jgi:hypothetical protein
VDIIPKTFGFRQSIQDSRRVEVGMGGVDGASGKIPNNESGGSARRKPRGEGVVVKNLAGCTIEVRFAN